MRRIRERGALVFLDLKFHDIPNTVAKAVAAAVQLDVQMLTVHTSGGLEMLKAAEQSAQETALARRTHPAARAGRDRADEPRRRRAGGNRSAMPNVEYQVGGSPGSRCKAGLRGLVCSPLEIVASCGKSCPPSIQLVTPGIRTGAEKADDQKRTLTPREAIAAGASWLVIGRPIYAAENPRAAAEKILKTLG